MEERPVRSYVVQNLLRLCASRSRRRYSIRWSRFPTLIGQAGLNLLVWNASPAFCGLEKSDPAPLVNRAALTSVNEGYNFCISCSGMLSNKAMTENTR
jgi:hypothetical protein